MNEQHTPPNPDEITPINRPEFEETTPHPDTPEPLSDNDTNANKLLSLADNATALASSANIQSELRDMNQ